jgi:hypothetical protein
MELYQKYAVTSTRCFQHYLSVEKAKENLLNEVNKIYHVTDYEFKVEDEPEEFHIKPYRNSKFVTLGFNYDNKNKEMEELRKAKGVIL